MWGKSEGFKPERGHFPSTGHSCRVSGTQGPHERLSRKPSGRRAPFQIGVGGRADSTGSETDKTSKHSLKDMGIHMPPVTTATFRPFRWTFRSAATATAPAPSATICSRKARWAMVSGPRLGLHNVIETSTDQARGAPTVRTRASATVGRGVKGLRSPCIHRFMALTLMRPTCNPMVVKNPARGRHRPHRNPPHRDGPGSSTATVPARPSHPDH